MAQSQSLILNDITRGREDPHLQSDHSGPRLTFDKAFL